MLSQYDFNSSVRSWQSIHTLSDNTLRTISYNTLELIIICKLFIWLVREVENHFSFLNQKLSWRFSSKSWWLYLRNVKSIDICLYLKLINFLFYIRLRQNWFWCPNNLLCCLFCWFLILICIFFIFEVTSLRLLIWFSHVRISLFEDFCSDRCGWCFIILNSSGGSILLSLLWHNLGWFGVWLDTWHAWRTGWSSHCY